MEPHKTMSTSFGKFSNWVARFTGSPTAFIIASLTVIVWALTGPVFHYSDTWQLVINTGTTVITFLMVFVIQQSQNKETAAMQIKLNELIAANKNASNRVVGIENLSEEELKDLKTFYDRMADLVKTHRDLFTSQSVDKPNPLLSKDEHETNTEKNIKSKPTE